MKKTGGANGARTEATIPENQTPLDSDHTIFSSHGTEDAVLREGSRTEEISEYTIGEEEKQDESHGEEVPTTSRQPRIIYDAVTVSDEKEERIRQLIVNAPLVDGTVVETSFQEQPNEASKRRHECLFSVQCVRLRRNLIVVSLLVVSLISILIVVVLQLTPRSPEPTLKPIESTWPSLSPSISSSPSFYPTSHPTNGPTSDLFNLVKSIIIPVSGEEILSNKTSPQYQVLEWMVGQIGVVPQPYSDPIRLSDEERIIQRYVMALIYFSMAGSELLFLSNHHECHWNQSSIIGEVNCELIKGVHRPISLDFEYGGLQGTIPNEIGELSSLEQLVLSLNYLEGTIPESIGKLTKLKRLDLATSNLSGTFPSSIVNLSDLEYLHVGGCGLSGIVAFLCFGQNNLQGTIPPNIDKLTSLKFLSFQGNNFIGTIPLAIGNLANLEYLILAENNLKGLIPSSLENLNSLKHLVLGDNNFTGTIPHSIFQLAFLENIHLADNFLTGEIPSHIGNSGGMRTISLQKNVLTGNIPSYVKDCHDLIWLRLSNNMLSGTIPNIGNADQMQWLSLEQNVLTGTVPMSLENITTFIKLELHLNKLTGDINFLCKNGISEIKSDCGGGVTPPEVWCICCSWCCDSNDNCDWG